MPEHSITVYDDGSYSHDGDGPDWSTEDTQQVLRQALRNAGADDQQLPQRASATIDQLTHLVQLLAPLTKGHPDWPGLLRADPDLNAAWNAALGRSDYEHGWDSDHVISQTVREVAETDASPDRCGSQLGCARERDHDGPHAFGPVPDGGAGDA